jgi:hypothetical protein
LARKQLFFSRIRMGQMSLFSILVALAVGGIGCVGGGLMSLAILHWAWKGESAPEPGGNWPCGKRILVTGAVLGIVFGVLKLILWQRFQV